MPLHCVPMTLHDAQVRGAIYSLVDPTPLAAPQLVATSADALQLLGLDPHQVTAALWSMAVALIGLDSQPMCVGVPTHEKYQGCVCLGGGDSSLLGGLSRPQPLALH
jgi:hypothetical protein